MASTESSYDTFSLFTSSEDTILEISANSFLHRLFALASACTILNGPRKVAIMAALESFKSAPTILRDIMGCLSQMPAVEMEHFNSLSVIQLNDAQLAQNNTCILCDKKFQPLENVKLSSCHHYYHEMCLKNYCKLQDKCPKYDCSEMIYVTTDTQFLNRNQMCSLIIGFLCTHHPVFLMEFLEEVNSSAQPVSESVVQNLPMVKFKPDHFSECVICFVKFEKEETVLKLPCTHSFHERCIKRWFRIHNTCPYCRFEIE